MAAFGQKQPFASRKLESIFAALRQELILSASSDPGMEPGSRFHIILLSLFDRRRPAALHNVI
jgi:hypothetical protein